jgi:hypothetical protein
MQVAPDTLWITRDYERSSSPHEPKPQLRNEDARIVGSHYASCQSPRNNSPANARSVTGYTLWDAESVASHNGACETRNLIVIDYRYIDACDLRPGCQRLACRSGRLLVERQRIGVDDDPIVAARCLQRNQSVTNIFDDGGWIAFKR